MSGVVRVLRGSELSGAEAMVRKEWLVANGLGGYASGTVAGLITRRFHGILIAALPAPLGRFMMVNHLLEQLRLPGGNVLFLEADEVTGDTIVVRPATALTEFRLEAGLPVWRYELDGFVLEKHLVLPHRQNTVYVTYHLLAGPAAARLELRPLFHFRPHEGLLSGPPRQPYALTAIGDRYELSAGPELPTLRMLVVGGKATFVIQGTPIRNVFHALEASRGYESTGDLWSSGTFHVDLEPGMAVTFVASTESWDTVCALPPEAALAAERERRWKTLASAHPAARAGMGAELVLAADQFVITPAGRVEDAARARAAGDELRTVIAGYHWFTDWGRDTMISLEGLTLSTGRAVEAAYILRTFAHYVRDGLIPNMFPEGENQGLYHTADATLWFFHALDRYLEATNDRDMLHLLLPTLVGIVDHHLRGTHFGIHVDPADGLLVQGAEGYQLTWMDAKVDGWVVTPRRGKAVEINALWHNALRLLGGWLREAGNHDAGASVLAHADRSLESFNRRFWFADGGYLYDVVDGERGDDTACRPNQILSFSLRNPVLDPARWPAVLDVVQKRLLTPFGLRSLAPGHPDYKATYDGDLRSRDAAYHQGTVWAWLIGPFVDAWLRVHPGDRRAARALLQGFEPHLGDACSGQISEVFDAEAPFAPRGCVAQAWSVAEVLRCWVNTAE